MHASLAFHYVLNYGDYSLMMSIIIKDILLVNLLLASLILNLNAFTNYFGD